jgi:hypothetical protein
MRFFASLRMTKLVVFILLQEALYLNIIQVTITALYVT